ncbi:MAG TPA: PEMT/PEM2 methyltransferase family protein [Candidatus Dormibacteraeota bacterium]|nr:PEMT/PEM2 methyltransferase family protein [Candidatus Dormibacteraeota bacterium]
MRSRGSSSPRDGARGRPAPGPEVVAPPPLLYLFPFLAGVLLDRLVRLQPLPRAVRLGVGPVLLGLGAAWSVWFIRTMRDAGTPIDPRRRPTHLVQGGPFRFTRNPGYVGLAAVYTGLALLTGARWPLLLLPGVLAAVDRGVVQAEERFLLRAFGEEYERYRRRVRRWL